MTDHRPLAAASLAFLAPLALLGGCASTQGAASGGSTAAAAAPAMDDEAMMEAVMAAAAPGEMHAWLLEDVGAWRGTSTSWPGEGADPIECAAAFTVESELGGRFIEIEYTSTVPGMPEFEGLAITGYDNAAGEFQSMWIDSYGTTMMTGTGKRSDDGRSLETSYRYHCPMRGRRVSMFQVITHESPDHQVHRMWAEDMATGRMYLMMEASYDRVDGD